MNEPRYLLDTNICIYVLDGEKDNAPLRHRIEQLEPGDAVVSAIAYAEILLGHKVSIARREKQVMRFFRMFPVVAFDQAAAHAYAGIPFKRGSYDRLIAAHAIALDLTLITANERDFADLAGLRVENWTQ